MTKAILAYCVENQFAAAKIVSALEGKAQIEKVIFDDDNGIQLLDKHYKNSDALVLLLISDNFLKSENCMNGALEVVQRIGAAKRLIPITTDGVYSTDNSSNFINIPTSFDRVSHVIQFMNHWQDKYLDMRKTKPANVNELANAEEVRIVRNISSEVGEMLRYLRAMEYFTTDQFEESNYIILYRILGLDTSAYRIEKKPEMSVAKAVFPEVENTKEEPTTLNGSVAKIPLVEEETKRLNIDINITPSDVQKDSDLSILLHSEPFKEVKETVAPLGDIEKVVKSTVDNTLENIAAGASRPISETPSTLEALIEDIKKDTRYIIEEPTPESDQNVTKNLEDVVSEEAKTNDNKEKKMEVGTMDNIESFLNEDTLTPTNNVHNNISKTPEIVQNSQVKEESVKKNIETLDSIIKSDTMKTEETTQNSVASVEADINPFDLQNISNEITENTEGVAREEDELLTLRDALDNTPTNGKLRYDYASKLAEQGQYQEAIEQLELLVEIDRTHIDAYMLMAFAAEQSGDYLLSLNCLEKVTLLNPEYPGIFYKLGMLVTERFKGPKRKAIRYFSDAVQHNPADADAHFQLAKLELENNSDLELVTAHLQDALTHNPKHAEAAMELAKVQYEMGDKESAALLYARAWSINPQLKTDANDELFKIQPQKEVIISPEPVAPPEIAPFNDNGMVVLITGATSGIGKATADIFAKHGYRLILTGRRNDRLEDLKNDFESKYRNKNLILSFDVRQPEAVQEAVNQLEEEFKNIDILINNAGLASGLSPIHEGNLEDWDVMIDTNIKGLLYMTRAVAPHMVARQKGHIINLSSIAGKEIYPNGNVYNASKHAVDALTRSMRVDLYKYNIRVSQVAPGAVEETEFAIVRFHGDAEKAKIYEDFTPLKSSDVAETIFFIASRPEYVNIQDVVMMGTQQANANFVDRSGRKDR